MKKLIPYSIRGRLLLLFIIIIILSVSVMSLFSIRLYKQTLMRNAERHSDELLQTINSTLSSYIEEYSNVLSNALLSERIHKVLLPENQTKLTKTERLALLQNYKQDVLGYRENLNEVYAISLDRSVYPALGVYADLPNNVESYEWYQDLFSYDGGFVVDAGESWLRSIYPNSKVNITCARLMKEVQPTHTPSDVIGALVIELNPTFIHKLLASSLSDESHLIITNADGLILYDSSAETVGSHVVDLYPYCTFQDGAPKFSDYPDNTHFYAVETFNYGWAAFLITETTGITHQAKQFLQPVIIVAIAIVAMSLMISFVVSKSLVRPIQNIQTAIEQLHNGDLSGRVAGEFPVELKEIVQSYNATLDDLETLLTENYIVKLDLLEVKYYAFQAQMNPHFIFNVLGIINSQLLIDGKPETAKTIRSLARLIRYNLNNAENDTTLSADVNYLRIYCDLLQEVYKEFHSYTIDLSPEANDCKIPSFILQPIVENAVIHGMRDLDRPGKLHIAIACEDQKVVIHIRDNGVGFPKEDLRKLRNRLDAPLLTKRTAEQASIGILNVHSRLILKYGQEYGLQIDSKEGVFTDVCVSFPLVDSPKEYQNEKFDGDLKI